jgi:hypothetical protein
MGHRHKELAKTIFLLFITAILPGCVILKESLTNPAEAKLDDRLIGAWKWQDEELKDHTTIVFIGKAEVRKAPPGLMKAIFVDHDEKKQVRISSHLFVPTFLETDGYANVLLDESQLEGENEKTWPPEPVHGWWLAKYSVEGDQLIMRPVDPEPAEIAVAKGEVRGIVQQKGMLKIKTIQFPDSKDLTRFLINGGEKKVFTNKNKSVFTRIK